MKKKRHTKREETDFYNHKLIEGSIKNQQRLEALHSKKKEKKSKLITYDPYDSYIKETLVKPLLYIGFPIKYTVLDNSSREYKIKIEDALDFFISRGIFIEIGARSHFRHLLFINTKFMMK